MKKFLITLIFLTISSVSFAEQGQIKQNGFFAGTSKVLGDDKGNFTIIYDGVLGLKALEGTTFGDKSSMRCVGSIVGFAGQAIVKNQTRENLPEGFQSSSTLLEKGMCDGVYHRKEINDKIKSVIKLYAMYESVLKNPKPMPIFQIKSKLI